MGQYKSIFIAIFAVLLLTSGCGKNKINDTINYKMTDRAIINPFMGFAVSATNKKAVGENSLVYIDITFKELQPHSAQEFDFKAIESENNIKLWKEQGKHAVLRFICDYPSDEMHTDIPDWLMEITGDGTSYDTSYGKGYCPDYSNEEFIKYHKNAIEALAQYFDDGFVSYVELGSLGHWGEWHIKQDAGAPPMPKEDIREKYVRHYIDAFSGAKLLMRRPFNSVKDYSLGLYNDMIGADEDTQEWLDWIDCGGEYSQTGEKNALTAVPEFWKNAPSGGELTGSVPMQEICTDGLDKTVELIKKSHTTFIGPKTPIGSDISIALQKSAGEKLLSSVGYRIGISQVTVQQKKGSDKIKLTLKWENRGVAPIYFDLPVKLYTQNSDGEFLRIAHVDINLSEILPMETVYSDTVISADSLSDNSAVYLGIIDPMTKKPALMLTSNQNTVDKYIEIYNFS